MMDNRIASTIVYLALAILVSWPFYWFFTNHERDEREIKADVSAEARGNPLLAAERFLTHLGIQSASITGRDKLFTAPKTSGLLLVHRLGTSMPSDKQTQLMDWIRQGGHLVVTPSALSDESNSVQNSLLDEVGVELVLLDLDAEEEPDESESLELALSEPEIVTNYDYAEYAAPVSLHFSNRRILLNMEESADLMLTSEVGAHLLQFKIGAGHFTVLSDNAFLTNNKMGNHDHALLLALLAGNHKHAWLLYSSNMPSLLSLIWQYATEFILSLSILIFLTIIYLTRYSGPKLRDLHTSRRNLMEHLTAAADFSWRVEKSKKQTDKSQMAIEQEWLKRHSVIIPLDNAQRCQWISKHTGLSADDIERALYGTFTTETAFIKSSHTLQKLAAALHSGKPHNPEHRVSL